MNETFTVATSRQGLVEITADVRSIVSASGVSMGLCCVFLPHTSASLVIQENADPSAREDLEGWLCRLVPEEDALFRHTAEGPDDMPAHIKAVLTATSLTIPVDRGAWCSAPGKGFSYGSTDAGRINAESSSASLETRVRTPAGGRDFRLVFAFCSRQDGDDLGGRLTRDSSSWVEPVHGAVATWC